jgi:hypothetical protein
MKIGKYQFENKAEALGKIESLGIFIDEEGNKLATHSHSIVKLGNIVLEKGEYNEAGDEIKSPVFSEKYHLDVMWDLKDTVDENGNIVKADHPDGWKQKAIEIQDEGVHSFFGVKYQENKFL